MNTYTPDKWVIVRTADSNGEYYKVFASWYGGYLGSDEWKLSSGIVGVVDKEKVWEFPQETGSVYICHKSAYGMSNYAAGVLSNFQDKLKDNPIGMLEVMDENFDIVSTFKK